MSGRRPSAPRSAGCSSRRLSLVLSAVLGLGGACAGSLEGSAARRYQRDGLEQLPLQTIDVAVTVAGPPATSGPRFDVPSFEPPRLTSVIRPPVEEEATQAVLVSSLRRRLADAGFEVRMLLSGADASEAQPRLETGQTLQDILSTSVADAVLVVRVVPVDAFYIFVESDQTRIIDLGGGTLPRAVNRDRPEVRAGRLLVGQAFLFDRRTGARLWTRQLPDLPEDGRIHLNDPFLEYGFVAAADAGDPSGTDRAEKSSAAFVRKMFGDFPSPNDGGPAGADVRAELDAIDLRQETRRERFLDQNHFALEVGGNWTYQRVGLEGTLNDNENFPDLETGFVAPNGGFRLEPRISFVVAGGWTAGIGGQFGTIPADNERSYFRDSANADRGATVRVSGGTTIGLDFRFGRLLPLGADLFLWPTVGGFYERWSFDASPDTVIPTSTVDRGGALVNADALWRWSEVGFARASAGLRVGSASQGGEIIGLEIGLSLGFFL